MKNKIVFFFIINENNIDQTKPIDGNVLFKGSVNSLDYGATPIWHSN